MAAISTYDWSNPAGGDFHSPTNWSGGVVPGSGNDADLVALGAPYTVQDTYFSHLHGLQTAVGTTLTTSGPENILSLAAGTDGGVSAGVIHLSDYSELEVAGTFTNTGTISVNSVTHSTGIGLLSTTTFNGGGQILLSDVKASYSSNNFFVAQYKGGQLINVDNTISGAGDIGAYNLTNTTMSLTNDLAGVIDADGVNPLLINTGVDVTNAGLMEATGSGGLILGDSIDNTGTMAAVGGTHFATLAVDGGVILTGGGIVTLNAKGVIEGYEAGDALTNVDNTITGGGFIETPLTLVNDTAGIIDANSGRMLINVASTVTNAGLIEATGGGILLVSNTTIDSSSGGTVEVGKQIQLNKATLLGGSLIIDKGGSVLSSAFPSTINLEDGTVTNAGTLEGAGGGLTVDGNVANTGLVIAETGSLTITGAITGAGRIEVFGKSTLEIDGAQDGAVAFASGTGDRLVLGDSAAFNGTITGLSKTGANSIDLKDIAYGTGDTVTFKANKSAGSGGVLTVSDGTHTATIKLADANYSASTFALAQDSGTGVIVTDPSPRAFVAAMAAFAPSMPSGSGPGSANPSILHPMIAAPG